MTSYQTLQSSPHLTHDGRLIIRYHVHRLAWDIPVVVSIGAPVFVLSDTTVVIPVVAPGSGLDVWLSTSIIVSSGTPAFSLSGTAVDYPVTTVVILSGIPVVIFSSGKAVASRLRSRCLNRHPGHRLALILILTAVRRVSGQ